MADLSDFKRGKFVVACKASASEAKNPLIIKFRKEYYLESNDNN